MQLHQEQPISAVGFSPISPSFNSYSTSSDETLADIAVRVVQELSRDDDSALEFYSWEEEEEEHEAETTPHRGQSSDDEEEEKEEGEFEFAFVGREAVASPISADEIFYNGQIRPLYPLFNTDLLLDHPDFHPFDSNFDSKPPPPPPAKPARGRRPQLKKLFKQEERGDGDDTDSSEELENLPEGTYCVWNPKKEAGGGDKESKPEIRKKCKSAGNDSKRWKFRDLLYRSHSDGKEPFVFLAPTGYNKKATAGGDKIKGGEKGLKEAAGEKQKRYAKDKVLKKEGEKRQPYRQDVVGLLSNVSGVSRNLHSF